jgi:prepilin-type N-terminal cleavage/methylation domain-containing protein
VPRPAPPRAFTLLEVAVALALLLLIGALAVPSLSGLARARGGDAARARLDAALAVAAATSRARGEALVLRAVGSRLELVRPTRGAPGPEGSLADPRDPAPGDAAPKPAADDGVPERVLERWDLPVGVRVERRVAADGGEPGPAAEPLPTSPPLVLAICLPTGESRAGVAWRLVLADTAQEATLLGWSARWDWQDERAFGESAPASPPDEPTPDEPAPDAPAPVEAASDEPPARDEPQPIDAAKPASATRGPRPRVRRSRRRSLRPHGSTLLECVLALTLFVAVGLATLRLADGAGEAQRRAQHRAGALDRARSALAKVEAALASPENLSGREADAQGRPSPYMMEVALEPSPFRGLAHATVTVTHDAGESVTLHQLVPLRREPAP